MIRKAVMILSLLLISMFTTACSKSVQVQTSSTIFHQFTSTIIDGVHQKNPIILDNGLSENYTMILDNFSPLGSEFKQYNDQYDKNSTGRILSVTERTRFFIKLIGNQKKEISIDEFLKTLKESVKLHVDFWSYISEKKQNPTLPPNHINKYLVADEIDIYSP